ncbi:MAG: NADH-quinone oxidoreductase subunit C [Thermoplasmata archaeon]
MQTTELATILTSKFGDQVLGVDEFSGLLGRVRFQPAIATELFRTFRDDLGFTHLSMVGAVDWVDHREVFYALWSDVDKVYVMLSTNLPSESPSIASAVPIWPSANAHEREAWDLVGVRFVGHPDLRRIFMPEGYAYHPLLRSFKIHEPEDLEVKVRSD